MSYFLKIINRRQLLACKPTVLFANKLLSPSLSSNHMRVATHQMGLHTKPPPPHGHPPPPPPPPPPPHGQPPPKDDIEYVVKFTKQRDVKQIFKNFYSLYGPIFIVSHITVSLASLGFFCTLVWFTVDPSKFIPDFVIASMGQLMAEKTGQGGKFVFAYGIHKLLLPVRLGISIALTRKLSPIVRRTFPSLYKEKP